MNDDENEAPTTPWACTSEELAAWAIDKVLTLRERADRIEAQCEQVVKRARDEAKRAEEFFTPQLALWMLEHPPAKGKTLHLPTGSFAARTVPERLAVDKEKALAWARETSAIPVNERITYSVSVADVEAYVKENGLLPPGTTIQPETETFAIKGPKR